MKYDIPVAAKAVQLCMKYCWAMFKGQLLQQIITVKLFSPLFFMAY
jgi:hypothetical protein